MEVTIAVGIVAFCILAIVGLAGVGSKVNRDSVQQMQASNLGVSLLQLRREDPMASVTTGAYDNFPIGSLATAAPADGTAFVTNFVAADGRPCATNSADVAYRILHRITPDATARRSTVALRLEWPPQNPASSCEFVTEVLWP